MSQKLREKISMKEARIAVLGLGYVGLPTAALFANLGFRVKGIDVNPEIVSQVNNCKLKTKEKGLQELIVTACKRGPFSATTEPFEALDEADVVIICVQTPVSITGNADLSFLKSACEAVGKSLKRNKLIILQSTVPPKTINSVVVPLLENRSGLKCGMDFWLAYCPERLAPGNGLHDLTENTRLIGAHDKESALLSEALFCIATSGKLLVSDISSTEVSKLAENTFRFVNIAFANELSIICKQIDVDVKEVIRLANSHPRVNIHQPGCGAGGPCLSKDTNLLLSANNADYFKADVISAAIKMNKYMPIYLADLVAGSLQSNGKEIHGSKVAVLGTAYKGDVDDSRDSPAKGIICELKKMKMKIVVYDPNCAENFGERKVDNLYEAVDGVDCIIIATDHKEFSVLNLAEIKRLMNEKPIIVDGKRIISPSEAKKFGFEYVSTSCASEISDS
jgi:UDP-N-acetyl-D-mannosaminuronic acid dehydrogenase